MSITGRTRSLAAQGLKVQRRVAIAQALFWPAVLGAGALIAAVTVAVARSRRSRQPRLAEPVQAHPITPTSA